MSCELIYQSSSILAALPIRIDSYFERSFYSLDQGYDFHLKSGMKLISIETHSDKEDSYLRIILKNRQYQEDFLPNVRTSKIRITVYSKCSQYR